MYVYLKKGGAYVGTQHSSVCSFVHRLNWSVVHSPPDTADTGEYKVLNCNQLVSLIKGSLFFTLAKATVQTLKQHSTNCLKRCLKLTKVTKYISLLK